MRNIALFIFLLISFPALAANTGPTVNSIVQPKNGGTGLASAIGANNILGVLTTGTYSPLPIPSCTGGTNALSYSLGVGFNCNAISTAAVSVTAATPDLIINPSPGLQTFTVGTTSPINALAASSTYTVLSSDMGKTITHASGSSVAVTLPRATTTGFTAGASYTELNLGAGAVTITPTTSLINTTTSLVLPGCASPPACPWAYFISDGTNWNALTQ